MLPQYWDAEMVHTDPSSLILLSCELISYLTCFNFVLLKDNWWWNENRHICNSWHKKGRKSDLRLPVRILAWLSYCILLDISLWTLVFFFIFYCKHAYLYLVFCVMISYAYWWQLVDWFPFKFSIFIAQYALIWQI